MNTVYYNRNIYGTSYLSATPGQAIKGSSEVIEFLFHDGSWKRNGKELTDETIAILEKGPKALTTREEATLRHNCYKDKSILNW